MGTAESSGWCQTSQRLNVLLDNSLVNLRAVLIWELRCSLYMLMFYLSKVDMEKSAVNSDGPWSLSCSDLNEAPVGGTVWGGLVGVALLV